MVEMSALGWTTAQRKKQRKPTSMGHWDWNYQENTQGTRSPEKCNHRCAGRMVRGSGEARRWQASLEKQESMFWWEQYQAPLWTDYSRSYPHKNCNILIKLSEKYLLIKNFYLYIHYCLDLWGEGAANIFFSVMQTRLIKYIDILQRLII